ncbi:MAG TPA: hypothetical protein VIP52_01480 [Candidatus Dormibacteraeota bacterium]
MRVLLGRPPDPTHTHRTTCEDCGRAVYLGDAQRALKDRRLVDVVTRCQACDLKLGDLRRAR